MIMSADAFAVVRGDVDSGMGEGVCSGGCSGGVGEGEKVCDGVGDEIP